MRQLLTAVKPVRADSWKREEGRVPGWRGWILELKCSFKNAKKSY